METKEGPVSAAKVRYDADRRSGYRPGYCRLVSAAFSRREASVGSRSRLLTLDTYGQQFVDELWDVWKYTMDRAFSCPRSAQTFGAGVEANGVGT